MTITETETRTGEGTRRQPRTARRVAKPHNAFGHPTRVAIIETIATRPTGSAAMSPKELSDQLGEPLGNVSYHVRELRSAGILRLARKTQRRGAIEHYYELSARAANELRARAQQLTAMANAIDGGR
jgi:DNA-binding transcriptional ArsR family regulator